MASYARIADGIVVELFDALPVFTPALMATIHPCGADVTQGWTYDGSTFAAPATPPAPSASTTITSLAFLDRFTDAEQLAIATAAQSTPALQLWLAKATAAQVIDLTDDRTKAGLDALVTAGLISSDRKTAILTP